MKPSAIAVAAAVLAATAAEAEPFPPTALLQIGYREARLVDFEGTPGAAARRADPDGLLAVSADFNGDGRPDEVRILLNEERQIAYVTAAIVTDQLDTYILRRLPLARAADTGIRAAPPGPRGLPGVAIFSISGGEERRLYFDGEEFRAR